MRTSLENTAPPHLRPGGRRACPGSSELKASAQVQIIADHLAGAEGRTKVEHWVPRWLAFPPASYTERGGVGSVRSHARVTAALVMAEDERRAAAAAAEAADEVIVEPEGDNAALASGAAEAEDAATEEPAGEDMPLAA